MRKSPIGAFTLIELLTVMTIIAILSGLVVGIAGYATKRASRARATGDIEMLKSVCEVYKTDNGAYPREVATAGTSATDVLSPKQHFNPSDPKYAASSLFLYKELTGDKKGANGTLPDGVPDDGEQRYMKEYDPRILNAKKDTSSKRITEVRYLQDPFGFSYGYSTAAAATEQDFKRDLLLGKKPNRLAGNALPGFNVESFDLWSTSGNAPGAAPAAEKRDLEWAKWLKNW